MVINLDVLLLENFVVDLFLLHVTSQCLRIRTRLLNLSIASGLGALYVLTVIFRSTRVFTAIPFQIIMAVVMVAIAFRRNKLFFILKGTGIYILLAMLLSGICFYFEVNGIKSIFIVGGMADFSYKEMIFSLLLLYLVIFRAVVYIKDRKEIVSYTYNVEVVTNSRSVTLKAFLDTGNELREPVTNLPVMVVQKDAFKDFELRDKEKLYIPYQVINGGAGRMEGFKPNYIRIHYNNEETEARNVIIGLCENKLSEYNDYNALLSRGII